MSRLAEVFARAKTSGQPGLVTYVTAGDPTLARTAGVLRALDRAGATVIEVGVPFSDPLADGPVIERATERALASGTAPQGVLDLLASIRSDIRAGLVIQLRQPDPAARRRDVRRSRRRPAWTACSSSISPLEEAGEFKTLLAARGIDTILLLSPTTSDERWQAASVGSGFLYAISRLGVTGVRDHVADGAEAMVRRIRAVSDLPVALGFGISKPETRARSRPLGRRRRGGQCARAHAIVQAGASADLDTRVRSTCVG